VKYRGGLRLLKRSQFAHPKTVIHPSASSGGQESNSQSLRCKYSAITTTPPSHPCCVSGADPSAVDRHGNAALHMATLFGHLQLVKMLLKYDADVYQRGAKGAIPSHIAAREGHIHLIQVFVPSLSTPVTKTLGSLDPVCHHRHVNFSGHFQGETGLAG